MVNDIGLFLNVSQGDLESLRMRPKMAWRLGQRFVWGTWKAAQRVFARHWKASACNHWIGQRSSYGLTRELLENAIEGGRSCRMSEGHGSDNGGFLGIGPETKENSYLAVALGYGPMTSHR